MKTMEPVSGHTSKYEFFLERAKQVPSPRTVVVYPCDESSLRGAVEAAEAGLIEPVLVGPREKSVRLPRSIARHQAVRDRQRG